MSERPTYHHVGVLVPNMDDAIRWFKDAIGITIHAPQRMVTQSRVDPGEFGDEEPHEGVSYLAWSADGPPYYELVEAKGKGHGSGLHSLAKQGPGLHHVGMFVPDVDAEIGRLRERGISLQGRVLGPDGRTMACWTERSPETGLAVEYIDERMLAATQAWIETGERPQIAGAVR
jgi:catechol 2,3-dioxygenase-like lactoylglutathione lyase family enzyme